MNQHPNFTQLALIFRVFLRLGCTAFGGPVAHLGWFRREFVLRRRWVTEDDFASMVALCQVLPGATSSQVGMLVGYTQGRWSGVCAAWLGFTLPSALVMGGAGVILSHADVPIWLQILCRVAALWIVGHAVLGMARVHCPKGAPRWLGLLAMIGAAALPHVVSAESGFLTLTSALFIFVGALFGVLFLNPKQIPGSRIQISHRIGAVCLAVFGFLLLALPFVAPQSIHTALFRVGALVFGGGHVVLPLIQQEVVATNLVSADAFATGYGIVQAMPGPLFTIGSFLAGASGGVAAVISGTLMIFAPSALLVFGLLPWWNELQKFSVMQRALPGINAAVVGLVGHAWVHLLIELLSLLQKVRFMDVV
jgi:chromate transporter